MRVVVAGLALAMVALAGCFSDLRSSTTNFQSPGAFVAAVESGAKVRDIHATESQDHPYIGLAPADLDEGWGRGRYALMQVEWVLLHDGTPGGPDPDRDSALTLVLGPDGPHFGGHAGDGPYPGAAEQTEAFFANVTNLPPEERAIVVEKFLTCHCGPEEMGLEPADLDATAVWTKLGGVKQASRIDNGVIEFAKKSYYDPRGAWTFTFVFDVAILHDKAFVGSTEARVMPTDQVWFEWWTDEVMTDAEAYDELQHHLDGTSIAIPPPQDVTWQHGIWED